MMILRTSPASPFGRKVKLSALILDLMAKITIERGDTTNPDDTLRQQNPLGKIPILIPEDGVPLFDSRVIVEYLDHLAGGGKIIPADPAKRFPALRLQAIADGILDAAILCLYEERWRAEDRREPKWVDHQRAKMTRALTLLEANVPGRDATPTIGQIALACTLGYLEFRFPGQWMPKYPKLTAWLDQFAAAVPAYKATMPSA